MNKMISYLEKKIDNLDGLQGVEKMVFVLTDCLREAKELNKPNNKSLPTQDEAVSEGYKIARDTLYNHRNVLRYPLNDIYYSGWMDCFDWISKKN